ncbi:DUF5130 family protein [Gandjariella thermophila]|uniref:DUF5130 domain-containing protein n=1 Tax=Gandjariella thermophila TaxID=1931992 RepID=A0A4D4JAK0_9PSEU|nr:hypothetical protein GTS_39850 [Gandjariella thermophila]
MVAGDVAKQEGSGAGGEPSTAQRQLGNGEVVMPTGRVSIARRVVLSKPRVPFSPGQLTRLDEALTLATRTTGLDFSVYLGDLGEDTRATAENLHAATGERAPHAVLIAVSPGQRVVEVVTGEESHRRLADRGCKLAVMSMVASFKEGDLFGGLIGGLRMLTDQAGSPPRH